MTVWISAGTEAVDAALILKDQALAKLRREVLTPTDRVGVIGNGVNDLPLLKSPGVSVVGVPRNAQAALLEASSGEEWWFASEDGVAGFLEFYEYCIRSGITCVIADRDGVLLLGDRQEELEVLSFLLGAMGKKGRPRIYVLTGSSVEENQELFAEPLMVEALSRNKSANWDPWLLLAENGAFTVNALTGQSRRFVEFADELEARAFLGKFRAKAIKRIAQSRLLSELGARGRLEHSELFPRKETMLTVDLRRVLHLPGLDDVRSEIVQLMVETATLCRLEYGILGVGP